MKFFYSWWLDTGFVSWTCLESSYRCLTWSCGTLTLHSSHLWTRILAVNKKVIASPSGTFLKISVFVRPLSSLTSVFLFVFFTRKQPISWDKSLHSLSTAYLPISRSAFLSALASPGWSTMVSCRTGGIFAASLWRFLAFHSSCFVSFCGRPKVSTSWFHRFSFGWPRLFSCNILSPSLKGLHRWLSWLSMGLSRGGSWVRLRPDRHTGC